MLREHAEPKQPWATCLLTDILLTHLEEAGGQGQGIDHAALFRGIEGIEPPADPERFLRDVQNWVPLAVLRNLLGQCERLSGRKDLAYHAARRYFDPTKKRLPSLFEIILRVLNDVRSVLLCADLCSAVQTNYTKSQSFARPGERPDLYVLAQFDAPARPAAGSLYFIQGFCEGFTRVYPFIDDAHCVEELSQLRIEDLVEEFPDYGVRREHSRLVIMRRGSPDPVVEAVPIALKPERVALPKEFRAPLGDCVVEPAPDGTISVLTPHAEPDPARGAEAVWAYRIERPGVLSHGPLRYAFRQDLVYNAPYSRFAFEWSERTERPREVAAEAVRRDVSRLLFGHLKQIKQTHMRLVETHIERRRLTVENLQLRREIEREYTFAGLIGQSPKMQAVFEAVRAVAATDVSVLIQGETGTGKELIARAVHNNSPRRAQRFVAINCGALAETLLESELFGHEKGAFTGAIAQRKGIFEVADGGTLFLDEIGEVPPSTQVKLLRVLQEGEFQRIGSSETLRVDVRIVAATNRRLDDLVAQGSLRQDLYYRLNVFPIDVPALRERAEDIPMLASSFLEKRKGNLQKAIRGVTPEAMACLVAYRWPGNVRELENVIQRMMVVAKGDVLERSDLPPEIQRGEAPPADRPKDLKDIARESAEIVERQAIVEALANTGGNVTKAARVLGISRATLQNRMKAFGLRGPRG